jgi:hypothetical protein
MRALVGSLRPASRLLARHQAVPPPVERQAYVIPESGPAVTALGQSMERRRKQRAATPEPTRDAP